MLFEPRTYQAGERTEYPLGKVWECVQAVNAKAPPRKSAYWKLVADLTGVKVKVVLDCDYLIKKEEHNIYAINSNGAADFSGTNASAILQSSLNVLTPKNSGHGKAGGKVKLSKGAFHLAEEWEINGWEGKKNPYSQIIIEGQGNSTQLVQNTPGKNAIVVRDCVNFIFRDFRIYTGLKSKSCILGDSNGSYSEMSCWKSKIENVPCDSDSTTAPAVYLKNFFDIKIPDAHFYNPNYHGVILENDSKTTNYGNSNLGFMRTIAKKEEPYAGLLIRTTYPNKFINMLTWANYECFHAYYGIHSDSLKFSSFGFVDIEETPYPVYFTGSDKGNETRWVSIKDGYLLPRNTGITNTLYTGGNKFGGFVENNLSVKLVDDQSEYRPINHYDLDCNIANPIIKSKRIRLEARQIDGSIITQ